MGTVARSSTVSLLFGTTIASVTALGWDGVTRDVVETTNLGSTNNWKEFAKGYKDGGEVTLEANYIHNNATHGKVTGILEDFSDDTSNTSSTLTVPDGAGGAGTHTMPLALTSWSLTSAVGEVLTFSATLKVMGEPTFMATGGA